MAKAENAKTKNGNGESKRQRFQRIAPPRMTALNARARLVCNLAASSYDYTEQEKQKIIDSGFKIAHAIKAAFEQANSGRERDDFSF
jgi:hypothetical protein